MSPYEYFELVSLEQKREKFLKMAKDLRKDFEAKLSKTMRSYKNVYDFERKLLKFADKQLFNSFKGLDKFRKYEKQSKAKQEMNMYQETEVFYLQEKAVYKLLEVSKNPSRDTHFVEYYKNLISIANIIIAFMEKSKQRVDEILSHETYTDQQRLAWGNKEPEEDLENIN